MSIVQPVSGLGLVLLAVFSHFYLKVYPLGPSLVLTTSLACPVKLCCQLQERLHAAEWGAVVVSTIGTIGLGATAGGSTDPAASKPLSKTRIAAVLLMFSLFILAAVFARVRGHSRQPRRPMRLSASTCGLQVSPYNAWLAGLMANSSLKTRVGNLLHAHQPCQAFLSISGTTMFLCMPPCIGYLLANALTMSVVHLRASSGGGMLWTVSSCLSYRLLAG